MAQLASASGLGPEGPVFESQYPDKIPAAMPVFFYTIIRQVKIGATYKTGAGRMVSPSGYKVVVRLLIMV